MMYRTHIMFALFLALLTFEQISNKVNTFVYTGIILFSSLIPDIDITTSKFGRKLKLVGYMFEYRGFFHTLLCLMIGSFIVSYFFSNEIVIAFSIGYFSHIILDVLNIQGVKLLYPCNFKLKGFIKVGSLSENILFLLFCILDVGLIMYYA